jgi:hypothetical protein
MATITFTNQTVQNFVTDLDENIVFKELHQGVDGFGVHYNEIFIDFVNPVTGTVDQVQFELCDQYETLHRIFYVIDSNKDKIHEELEMENLNDLYDFILIDEDNSPTEGQGDWVNHTTGQNLS